ncbi:MAG: hypothetical protein K0R15_2498 [Clostridiales bacterium]|jgi:rubrerythrin|nr:hypothetical protein [Clostridiales bacterium]
MSISFEESRTKVNLLRAFAGESQARNRYTFASEEAHKQDQRIIQNVFRFTADQEKEHAKVFYNYLKEFNGDNIQIDGTFPINISNKLEELLRAAQHNEYQEFNHDYKQFSSIAKEEGFIKVANSFDMIAEIEKIHGDRFGKYADKLEQERMFKEDTEIEWMCLACGHIHKGNEAPKVCPVCFKKQGWFMDFRDVQFAK